MNKKPWYQSKTNLMAIFGGVANIVSAIWGIELPPAFNEVVVSLILIFMRQGVENAKS